MYEIVLYLSQNRMNIIDIALISKSLTVSEPFNVKFSGIKNAPTFYSSSKLNSEYQKICTMTPPGV